MHGKMLQELTKSKIELTQINSIYLGVKITVI